MTRLGGHALYLKPGEIHLGQKENIKDTAEVLSRMVDVIEIRALRHETVTAFAEHATVPVINGLTDYNHPTQALCDAFTMSEHKLAEKSWRDLTVVFVGDATNVCTSTALIVTMLGGTFVHHASRALQHQSAVARRSRRSRPEFRALRRALRRDRRGRRRRTRRRLHLHRHLVVDRPRRRDPRPRAGIQTQVPGDHRTALARAPEHVRFMHCLPASRGVEVTDDVIDGPHSIVYPQSANRLHTEKGLLTWYVYPRLDRPSAATKALHKERVQAFLDGLAGRALDDG